MYPMWLKQLCEQRPASCFVKITECSCDLKKKKKMNATYLEKAIFISLKGEIKVNILFCKYKIFEGQSISPG